jgi:hypothetical protein
VNNIKFNKYPCLGSIMLINGTGGDICMLFSLSFIKQIYIYYFKAVPMKVLDVNRAYISYTVRCLFESFFP